MIHGDTNIGITNNNDGNAYVFSNDMILPVNNRTTTGPLSKEGNVNPTEKFGNINLMTKQDQLLVKQLQ